MAQKRMFNNSVVSSDDFIEMPDSSQNLYFHLSMQADDDGFVDNWKSIMRMTGKKDDDLKILIAKSFIIPFDTGILVIKHWRLNNYIQKDRYHETIYKEEKAMLSMDKSNVYNLYTDCIPSIDKSSIDKSRVDKSSSSIANDSRIDDLKKENVSDSCNDGNDTQKIIDFYNNNIGLITPYRIRSLRRL